MPEDQDGQDNPDTATQKEEPPPAGMTAEQATKLMDRLEALEKNRPPSLKDQLAELTGLKDDAVDQRKEGRDVADRVDAQIQELTAKLRAADIKAAAAAAKFADPDLVVEMLGSKAGEPADLVSALATRAPGLLAKPGRSADLGTGEASTAPAGQSGRDRLIAEIEGVQTNSAYK